MGKRVYTDASERRLAENEVVFRQLNEQVQKGIDEVNQLATETEQGHMRIVQNVDDAPLHFYCECSDENCVKRVVLGHDEYNRIHKHRDHFVVAPGHQVEDIERVIQVHNNYTIVKKNYTPPEHVSRLHVTDVSNT